jgi:hypothetical protein
MLLPLPLMKAATRKGLPAEAGSKAKQRLFIVLFRSVIN